jgi:hypothetical protein
MPHGLQIGMEPGVILLHEKGCLLLWSDSGNSGLQLSQRHDVAVRVDGLSGFQKKVYITLPADGCILNFFFDGEFTCYYSMDYHFDSGS